MWVQRIGHHGTAGHMRKTSRQNYTVEKRAYQRISMKDVPFSCHVMLGNRLCKVVCLSLSGSYLEGSVEVVVGEVCEVIITSQNPVFETPLSLSAKVVRVDERGTALEFCNTDDKDYMMLQTLLLYHSDTPYTTAAEFPATSHFGAKGVAAQV